MSEIKLKPLQKIRDQKLDYSVDRAWNLITQPRGIVEQAMKDYDQLIESYGDECLSEFNISKEELEKMIVAYKALLASTPDLC
jgi:hypothetical protein